MEISKDVFLLSSAAWGLIVIVLSALFRQIRESDQRRIEKIEGELTMLKMADEKLMNEIGVKIDMLRDTFDDNKVETLKQLHLIREQIIGLTKGSVRRVKSGKNEN